jgi:hypothetical protein
MSKLLFINTDQLFLQRMKQLQGSEIEVADTLLMGAEMIANPSNSFKAIYLNPNDSSYSALQFLQTAFTHRPATPVYFIDYDAELDSPEAIDLLKRHHVRGIFKYNVSAKELASQSDFKATTPGSIGSIRNPISSKHPGYIPVPACDFTFREIFPFDAFIEDDLGRLSLFATAGSTVNPKLIGTIGNSIHFYIRESNIIDIHERIDQTKNEMSFLAHFPISWKAAETLYKAKTLLRRIKSEQLSDSAVMQVHLTLCEIFQLVSNLQSLGDPKKLNRFIEQAQNSDRNIACATLSILMCKTLKFEKNAIEEILGVASLFQDISLYNSPFGDLSLIDPKKLTPEQHQYYLDHPTLSADLLVESTSIPAVTLQVIRQHHERKDRTGFPRKIGGMQLHPMAEILSLINEMIDQDPQTPEAENEIYRHYSDQIVLSYKGIQIRSHPVFSDSDSDQDGAAAA